VTKYIPVQMNNVDVSAVHSLTRLLVRLVNGQGVSVLSDDEATLNNLF
jgi:hypothetical protein